MLGAKKKVRMTKRESKIYVIENDKDKLLFVLHNVPVTHEPTGAAAAPLIDYTHLFTRSIHVTRRLFIIEQIRY